MKRIPSSIALTRNRASVALLFATAAVLLAPLPARAATTTWTNAAGGAWSDAGNWSAGVPGIGDVGVLPALSGPYTVTLDVSPSCDGITIAAGDPTLECTAASLASVGLVDNSGTITNFTGILDSDRIRNHAGGNLVSDPAGIVTIESGETVVNDGTLTIRGVLFTTKNVYIDGTGTVRFDDATVVDAAGLPQEGGWLKIMGGTVTGTGLIDKKFWNYGTWIVDDPDGHLEVHAVAYNRGTIRISNGGTLWINSPLLQSDETGIIETGEGGGVLDMRIWEDKIPGYNGNRGVVSLLRGGRIDMNGGDLTMYILGMHGGPIRSIPGGDVLSLDMGSLQQMSIAANTELLVTQHIDLMHRDEHFVVDGTIRVPQGSSIGFGLFPDSLFLQGSGSLELEGGWLGQGNEIAGVLVNMPGFTIRGHGTIHPPFLNYGNLELEGSMIADNGRAFTNVGTTRIGRGGLVISGSQATLRNLGQLEVNGPTTIEKDATLDNRGGLITASNTLRVGTLSTMGTLFGGRLEATGSGEFTVPRGGTLRDVTIGATAVLRVGANATALATGRFTNLGTIRVAGTGRLQMDGLTQFVQSAGTTWLEGGSLASVRDVQLMGGRLRGFGTVAANLASRGTVSPDVSASALRVTGNYTQHSEGTLELSVAGTATSEHSHFAVGGSAALDGTLTPVLAGGYVPEAGLAFPVFTFGSVSGEFDRTTNAIQTAIPSFSPLFETGKMSLITGATTGVGDAGTALETLRFFGRSTSAGASFVLELPYAATLEGRVYDAAGREVARLADGAMPAGVHSFPLRRSGGAEGLASGVYFARLEIAGRGVTEVRNARAVVIR